MEKKNIVGTVIGTVISVPFVVKGVVEGIYEGLTIDFNHKRPDEVVTYYGDIVEES